MEYNCSLGWQWQMVVWGVHSTEWWDGLVHLDWQKPALSESNRGFASQLEASQESSRRAGSELLLELVSAFWSTRDSLGMFHYCPYPAMMSGSWDTCCSLIHIGTLCLIPLCGHLHGNGFIGLFLLYLKNNTCPLGKIQAVQKSESRKQSWPQKLLARPNRFGILLFFFFLYVDETGYQVIVQPGHTFQLPTCSQGGHVVAF